MAPDACVLDSPTHTPTPGKVWVFTPRFNTLNMAPVSGNIANDHFNTDLSLVFTKNRFMWTVIKGIDIENTRSEMNYLLTNVRYRINLTRQLSVSPFLAYYSEHAHRLIDPISDFNSGLFATLQHGRLTVESFVLLVRLRHETARKDLISRLEIRYKTPGLIFSGLLFHNSDYFDTKRRLAIGFKMTLPEVYLTNSIKARTEVTGSFRISESPETKNLNGVFLSLAFPLRSKN